MKNRKVLKLVALFAVICIMTCAFALASFAAEESVEVMVTIANNGAPVVYNVNVDVTDVDDDGSITINDALVITHSQYYSEGVNGYETANSQYGLGITKLWGNTNNGSFGYYVNNASAWNLTDALVDGDYLYAFCYKDATSWTDSYAYFDYGIISDATADTPYILKLNKLVYNYETYAFDEVPVANAIITIDGADTEFTTNDEGIATITLSDTYSHIVSARTTDGSIITPPVLEVRGDKKDLICDFSGNTYYYIDNAVQSGFMTVEGKTCYFGADGAMVKKQLVTIDGKKYYFGADGAMYTKRLISVSGKKYYMGADGVAYTKRLISVNGKKYYMGADGVAYTKRLISVNGKKYYMGSDGVAYTKRLISVNGKKYYMGSDGVAYTKRLISVNGKKYYMGSDGVAYTKRLISVNGKKYYMGSNGVAYKSKLISLSGKKYYLGKDCIAYKNKWASLSGNKYYFGSDCVMVKGWKTIKNDKGQSVKYYFDTDGVYIPEKKLKAYSQSYNKLLQLAKLGNYNSSSKRYIYAFDTVSGVSGRKVCCIEYDAANDNLYISYMLDSGDYVSRNAILIEKKMTNAMEVIFSYNTKKNGKVIESGSAIGGASKRDYVSNGDIVCADYFGKKYTSSDYNSLMSTQSSHLLTELKNYLNKNSTVTLPSLGFDIY